jgi:hypothetical protein
MLANVTRQQTRRLTRGSSRQVRGLWQTRGEGRADERQWFGGSGRQWAVRDGGGRQPLGAGRPRAVMVAVEGKME